MEANMQHKEAPPQVAPVTEPASQQRKYVSMFRIDGVPILPPLMTAERRRQMQRIREKSIKLEKRLEEKCRKRLHLQSGLKDVREEEEEQEISDTPRSQQNSSSGSSCGSVSQRSYESDLVSVAQQQQLEAASYQLLSNLTCDGPMSPRPLEPKQAAANTIASKSTELKAVATQSAPLEPILEQRMVKLHKSETIIYDNLSKVVSVPSIEEQQQHEQYQHKPPESEQQKRQVQQLDRVCMQKIGDTAHFPLTPQNLILFPMNTVFGRHIPSIYINPPTPSVDTRNFCDASLCVATQQQNNLNSIGYICDKSFESNLRQPHDLRSQERHTNLSENSTSINETAGKCGINPPQRSATSPQLKSITVWRSPKSTLESPPSSPTKENPLVRSNSFTLICPSKALLEHIRKQKSVANIPPHKRPLMCPSASATRDTVESKAKRVQKVMIPKRSLPTARSQMKASAGPTSNSPYSTAFSNSPSATVFKKTARSPYEMKTILKTKATRPVQKTFSTTFPAKQVQVKNSMPILSSSPRRVGGERNVELNHERINDFEEAQRQKFLQLIAQQQEEQKRLQQSFEAQQKQLLEHLSAEMGRVQLVSESNTPTRHFAPHTGKASAETSPNSRLECSEQKSPNSMASANSSSLGNGATGDLPSLDISSCSTLTSSTFNNIRCTPRRRLFGRDPSAASNPNYMASSAGGGDAVIFNNSNTTNATPSANRRQQQHWENERRIAAATKINAVARGFLVRRLFQTEQIQRIVQTIRDTLIFVLNLHLEIVEDSAEANTPANIRLKARLLQQLSSACRTLHLVFFQTTIKERMEIIARDRKRMKTKLLTISMKRSPRVLA